MGPSPGPMRMLAQRSIQILQRVRRNGVTMRLSEAEVSLIVKAGGGRYVGTLNAIPEEMESIILFVSPQTRTTLGIPISRLTVEAVREQLAESDAAFSEVDRK